MLRVLVLIAAAVFFREVLSGNSLTSSTSMSPYWNSLDNWASGGDTRTGLAEASPEEARRVCDDENNIPGVRLLSDFDSPGTPEVVGLTVMGRAVNVMNSSAP